MTTARASQVATWAAAAVLLGGLACGDGKTATGDAGPPAEAGTGGDAPDGTSGPGPAGDGAADAPAVDAGRHEGGAGKGGGGLLAPVAPEAPADVSLCAAPGRFTPLPFTVTAAVYSRALERLVLLAADERAVHVVDVDGCRDRRIPLPRTGLSLSLHPDGQQLAVGHDGYVSVLDLKAGNVRSTTSVPAPATDVAFDARGRVHVFTRADSSNDVPLYTLDGNGGVSKAVSTLPADGRLRMSPDGQSLFWVTDESTSGQGFARVDPNTGTPVSRTEIYPPFPVCHDLFVSDDSQNLITACGSVVQLSADPTQDLRSIGALEGMPTRIQHLDVARAHGVLLAIRAGAAQWGQPDNDTVVQVYEPATWKLRRTIPLPLFETPVASPGPPRATTTRRTPGHGRAVFVRGDGARYYVLASVDDTPGRSRQGLVTLGPDEPAEPAVIPVDPTAATTARWLPPPVVFTPRPIALDHDVVDAGFSARLDCLVIASSRPASAVLLVDPDSGRATSIALPGPPRRLFVREDGVMAAAIHDGGVVFLDLEQARIRWRAAGNVGRVAFGAHPRALYDPNGSGTWFDLDTGVSEPAPIFGSFGLSPGPTSPFVVHPAGSTVYKSAVDEEVARYDGGPQPSRTASFSLRLFRGRSLGVCGAGLWITAGGGHLVLNCGRLLRLSASAATDLRYAGPLDGLAMIQHALYSARLDRFISLPGTYQSLNGYDSSEGELAVHEPKHLALEKRVSWKSADPQAPVLRGRFVFERPGGQLLVVGGSDKGNFVFPVEP